LEDVDELLQTKNHLFIVFELEKKGEIWTQFGMRLDFTGEYLLGIPILAHGIRRVLMEMGGLQF
jgi:hypothetical protein